MPVPRGKGSQLKDRGTSALFRVQLSWIRTDASAGVQMPSMGASKQKLTSSTEEDVSWVTTTSKNAGRQ